MSERARVCVCVCVCVCVYVCVLQTPMHLLRPGDRGKSVLGVLDGSRGGVEPGGVIGQWGMGGMRRKEEKEEKKNTLGMICY